jgi:hypothetical protein
MYVHYAFIWLAFVSDAARRKTFSVVIATLQYHIRRQVTGDSKAKPLTPDLIRRILAAYGEVSLAKDDDLVNEVYQAALGMEEANGDEQHPTNKPAVVGDPMLNMAAFTQALTHDIRLYDIRNEIRLTTNFDDVYFDDHALQEREEAAMATVTNESELLRVHKEVQGMRAKLEVSEELNRVNTIPAIDITAGTYKSKGLLVMLFSTIMITYFA